MVELNRVGAATATEDIKLSVFTNKKEGITDAKLCELDHLCERIVSNKDDGLAIDIVCNLIASPDKSISQKATSTLLDLYGSPTVNPQVKANIKESVYLFVDKFMAEGDSMFDNADPAPALFYLAAAFSWPQFPGQSLAFCEGLSNTLGASPIDDESLQAFANRPLENSRFITYSELSTFIKDLDKKEGSDAHLLFNSQLVEGCKRAKEVVKEQADALLPGQVAILPILDNGHWTALIVEKPLEGETTHCYYFDSDVRGGDFHREQPESIKEALGNQPPDKKVQWHSAGFNLQESTEYSPNSPASNSCGALVGLLASKISRSPKASIEDVLQALSTTTKPALEHAIADVRELMVLGWLAKADG